MIMFTAGVLWECLDQVAKVNGGDPAIFDTRRGFEWQDVARNGIGIGISFPIRKQERKSK